MGYKLLGFVVWNGGRWYLRRRFPLLTSRRVVTGVVVVAGIGLAAARSGGRRATAV